MFYLATMILEFCSLCIPYTFLEQNKKVENISFVLQSFFPFRYIILSHSNGMCYLMIVQLIPRVPQLPMLVVENSVRI